ncbi:MAG: leucyl aminopeptidase [Candidatus Cloacimonetes bacterium]|nr:leucyl aminopeptidase [Candidatus Cloacimonadota bacterium]
MKISLQHTRGDIRHAIVLAPSSFTFEMTLPGLDEPLRKALQAYIERENWEWKADKTAVVSFADSADTIILAGLGKTDRITPSGLRKSAAVAIRKACQLKAGRAALWLATLPKLDNVAGIVAETALLADYTFDTYLTKKSKNRLDELVLVGDADKAALEEAQLTATATMLARDLVNEPANTLLPEELASRAQQAGARFGFEVEVFDEKAIRDEFKMEAFWSVAQGSDNPPRFIVMRWKGAPSGDITALVGKGLTYDSGGYAMKPPVGMVKMKCDMGGSAAVIGAMCAIAGAKLKANVTAVVAACENMVSGHAFRNGDIIGSMAGKTIEVVNTDAEGRLTLIDAITYVLNYEKASRVIDIATLTGAVVSALDGVRLGVVSNDDELCAQLETASEASDERIWRLPHDKEYLELIKSKIADLRNSGKGGAGTITAGLFIREFVQDKPWLHLDIAGTAFADKPGAYWPEGATGSGVRLLYHLIKQRQS